MTLKSEILDKVYSLTAELCQCNGTSGDESYINDIIGFGEVDNLGDIICNINPQGNIKVMLEAHTDRVGFVVCGIDDKGFLKIGKVGGPDIRTLIGESVTVFSDNGPLFGVVCSTPPHLMKASDSKNVNVDDVAIDLGMDKESIEKIINIGDRIIINSMNKKLLNNNFSQAALDDRAGCAALILAKEKLENKLKNVNLILAFNTREEVGGSGAKVTSFQVEPDYCISVDAGFGEDYNCSCQEAIALGKGPSIGIAPILDFALMKKLKAIANEKNIPYQHDVMNGRTGTNADSIHNTKAGVKCALLSIPVCNMHTQVEIANIEDIENTANLMAEFVLKLEEENG